MATNKDRQRKLWEQREELSDEGKQLWDAMMSGDSDALEVIKAKAKTTVKQVVREVIVETDETQRIRLELKKMQQNSRVVVAECMKLQAEYIKKEEYFKANECRVAAMIHSNFIERLQRILDGNTAFDKDISFPDLTNTTNTIFIR